jgi:hypothetical protein
MPWILDLGCAGGGFVKDCLDDGRLAVGLEGSDFSRKVRRAECLTIPDFLFTCDITGDFDVLLERDGSLERIQFDVVTSWEVIEHIAERDLPRLAAKVTKHLLETGLCIMSVSTDEEIIGGIRLHQTVRPKPWSVRTFKELGFHHLEEYVRFFNTQFVRGPKYGASGSFHLVLSPCPSLAPPKAQLKNYALRLVARIAPSRTSSAMVSGRRIGCTAILALRKASGLNDLPRLRWD